MAPSPTSTGTTSAGWVEPLTYSQDSHLPRPASRDEDDRKDEKCLQDSEVQKAHDEAPLASRLTNIPLKYRILALVCACTFPMGRNWTEAALGPLKATLRTELGITNAQYGVIDSASNIVNSFWPIIGGILLDSYGVDVIILCCTSTIFIGAILTALASSVGVWRLLVGGQILMGLGQAVLDGAQNKILVHNFGYSGLALSFGIESSFFRVTTLVSGITAIPIRNRTGWYGWTLWIPTFLSGFSLIVGLTYVILQRRYVPQEYRLTGARSRMLGSRGKRFAYTQLFSLPWCFWMLPITQVLQSASAGAFASSATDLITMKGYKDDVAAFTASARSILAIVLTPFIGLAVDRWGHRFHLTALAPLLWIVACSVIGWSSVHPLLPVVIAAFAALVNAFPFQVSIPLLVRDQDKLGTAYGVFRSFNNSGSTLMGVVYGRVQDLTADMGYTNVLLIGISMKTLAFFIACWYIYMDKRHLGGLIKMGEKQRNRLEAEIVDPGSSPLTHRTSKRWVTTLGLVELACLAIAGWSIFIVYVI